MKQLVFLEITTRPSQLPADKLFKCVWKPSFSGVSGNFLMQEIPDAYKIQISFSVITISYKFIPGFLFIRVFASTLFIEQVQTT